MAIVVGLVPLLGTPTGLATDNVVLTDGTVLTSNLHGRTITVPVGAQVYFAADVTLSADTSIDIRGRLVDATTSGNAFDITLNAPDVSISGSVVTRSGQAASASTGDGVVAAANGYDAGDVRVQWAALGVFTLAEGAFIETGAGGAGGNAVATSTPSGPASIEAHGGTGGRGGDILLQGSATVLYGVFKVGNGGAGGDARSSIPEGSAALGGTRYAYGGAGGRSGDLALPTGVTLTTLYNAGKIEGGVGGAGGSAGAIDNVETPAACGQNGYHSSSDSVTRNGGNGCDGGYDEDKGGAGAPGLIDGGTGGPAWAYGGDGGRGGHGADGVDSGNGCDGYVIGGNGGRGGRGGNARAEGGNGGWGNIRGGRGGDASTFPGDGGRGGDGGDGGSTYTYGWCGAFDSNCSQFVLICWIDVEWDVGCGHGGIGGSGGSPGTSSRFPGAPGGSYTGLNLGSGAGANDAGISGQGGAVGDWGNIGGVPCYHGGSHLHYT